MIGVTDARPRGSASVNRAVAGLNVVAALCSALPLVGWLFGSAMLQSFGVLAFPIWPIASVAYLFLIAAFIAVQRGLKWAPALIAVPFVIAAIALAEEIWGVSFGVDTLLLADQTSASGSDHPGRPVANCIICFACIGGALLLARSRKTIADDLANGLALVALCSSLMSVEILLSLEYRPDLVSQFLIAPLPASLAGIALSLAFLVWRYPSTQIATPGTRSPRIVVLMIVPFVIVLPLLPMLFRGLGLPVSPAGSAGPALLTAFCTAMIAGALFLLISRRITRQNIAMQELSAGLNSASIILTQPDSTIIHWSGGCERLYGWSAAEAIGRKKYELLHSSCKWGGTDALRHVVGDADLELVEQCRDGSHICVLQHTSVLDRPDQEPLLVQKMVDITGRVRAETALRDSEARFMIAARAQQLGISHWDVASGKLEWSPGSEQRLGLPIGSVSTFEEWQALVEPEDVGDIVDTLQTAVANRQESIGFKYRFRPPDGLRRTIEGTATCLYDLTGTLLTVVGANLDVTERVEREEALFARDAQLRSIVETMPDALIVIDETGRIRTFSGAAEKMFGCDAATAIGQDVTLLMPDVVAAGHVDWIARYVRTGEKHVIGTSRELTARRADGTLFPIELNVGETVLARERVFTGVVRDLSERQAADKRLSDLAAELAHVSRRSAMSEVAADLAHELNQPLSATANFLAAARMLLADGGEGARVAELLQMGEEQTLRSGEIIRRLRDFLIKRDSEMHVESLERIVRDAVSLVLFGTSQFGVRLTYRLDPAIDSIFADRIQIQQVLVNLLRNAVEALRTQSAGNQEIIIASRALGDDMIEISVSDSGSGIPDHVLAQLYSRYATTKKGRAMGIGLSISRRIIEAHGGTLLAENRAAGGAVFRFTLPALEEVQE